MLRGQGSLKQLLGQDVVASSYARKRRAKAAADAEANASVAEQPAKRRATNAKSNHQARSASKINYQDTGSTGGDDLTTNNADLHVVRPNSGPPASLANAPNAGDLNNAPLGVATPAHHTKSNGTLSHASFNTPAPAAKDAAELAATPVSCPICNRALSTDTNAINSHIDHCLARSASAKSSKQRTVRAMFGSASTAAAERCRRMVADNAAASAASAVIGLADAPCAKRRAPCGSGASPAAPMSKSTNPALGAPQSSAAAAAGAATMYPQPREQETLRHLGAIARVDVLPPAACPVSQSAQQLAPSAQPPHDSLGLLSQAAAPAEAAAVSSPQHSVPGSWPIDAVSGNLQASNSQAAAAGRYGMTQPPVSSNPAQRAIAATPCTPRKWQNNGAGDHNGEAAAGSQSAEDPLLSTPQKQIRQSTLPGASPLTNITTFNTVIVGRRFQQGAECADGEPVTIQHEPSNSRDRNALIVLGAHLQVLGHLSAEVAKWLGPLVISNRVEAAGTVIEDPSSPSAPVGISVQVAYSQEMLLLSPRRQGQVRASLAKAAAAAAEAFANQGRRLGFGGSGECLRKNFALVVDTVRKHDGRLLSENEHELLKTFEGLSHPTQCLFLRLLQRRGPWFRLRSLEYAEVGDVQQAAMHLQQADLLATADVDSCRELIQMLTIPELKALSVGLSLKLGGRNGGNRDQMLAYLLRAIAPAGHVSEGSVTVETAFETMTAIVGPCCRLTGRAMLLMSRVRRLFFMSEHQDLSRFLVTNLGIVKYPSYRLNRPTSGFAHRSDMLEYEDALQHAAELDAAFEAGDMSAAADAMEPAWDCIKAGRHKESAAQSRLQQPFLRCYTAAWVYVTMATAGISLLEKRRQYAEATDLLRQLLGGACCPGRRGEWWTRLSIDTEHMGRPEEALEVAEAALADEWVKTGDRLALQRRVLRLGKPPRRWRKPPWAAAASWEPPTVTILGKPLASVIGLKSRFMGRDGEQCTVEEYALQYYASEEGGGWRGMHCEGGVWATLFGLLMWPVLFADVPEVFRTPFQSAPLDLGTDSFCSARQPILAARLAEIREGRAPDLIRACWEDNQGVICRGINWERQPLEELLDIAECVGGPGLAALCHLLAEDHSGWAGGMPDLLLWRVGDKRAMLSEVKGPRDRLSEQQRAWAAALSASGLAVEVLKVVEQLPKKRR